MKDGKGAWLEWTLFVRTSEMKAFDDYVRDHGTFSILKSQPGVSSMLRVVRGMSDFGYYDRITNEKHYVHIHDVRLVTIWENIANIPSGFAAEYCMILRKALQPFVMRVVHSRPSLVVETKPGGRAFPEDGIASFVELFVYTKRPGERLKRATKRILPRLSEAEGFVEAFVLRDTASNVRTIVSLWRTNEAARDVAATLHELADEGHWTDDDLDWSYRITKYRDMWHRADGRGSALSRIR